MLTLMKQPQTLPPVAATISVNDDVMSGEDLSVAAFNTVELRAINENEQAEAQMYTVMSDAIWRAIYPSLRSLASYLVHTNPLPCWRGQEDDMADDITQETVRRVIERAEKARRGEAPPIQSLKQMANTIAYNYYRDLKRHDYRISRLDTTTNTGINTTHFYPLDVHHDEHLLDTVAEKVDQDTLFAALASEIRHFPAKQRRAILTDLANRMYFDGESTSLQESFLNVGIELRNYRQPLPDNQKERSRHISLCSQAYKRVAHLPCAQQYA